MGEVCEKLFIDLWHLDLGPGSEVHGNGLPVSGEFRSVLPCTTMCNRKLSHHWRVGEVSRQRTSTNAVPLCEQLVVVAKGFWAALPWKPYSNFSRVKLRKTNLVGCPVYSWLFHMLLIILILISFITFIMQIQEEEEEEAEEPPRSRRSRRSTEDHRTLAWSCPISLLRETGSGVATSWTTHSRFAQCELCQDWRALAFGSNAQDILFMWCILSEFSHAFTLRSFSLNSQSLSLFVCQLWYLSIWGDQQTNNPFCEITLQDPHYLMKTDDRKQLHTPTKLMHKLPFPLWSHSLTSNNFSFTTSCLSWLQALLSLGIPVATVPRCSRRRRQMAAESGRRFPCRQENTNSGDLESISLSCAELLQRQPLKPGSLILQCIWMS